MFQSSLTLRLTPVNFNLKSNGSRAFVVPAPELPDDIRSCDSLNLFEQKLKTHLFKNYFNIYEFSSYPSLEPRSYTLL